MHVIFDRSHVTVRNVRKRIVASMQVSLQAYIGRLLSLGLRKFNMPGTKKKKELIGRIILE